MTSRELSSRTSIRVALLLALAGGCGGVTTADLRSDGGTVNRSSGSSLSSGASGSSTESGASSALDGGCGADENDAGNVPRSLVTLASGQESPAELVVDSISVYWTNSASLAPNARQGSVAKVPVGGGGVTTLASSQFAPADLATDTANVYWTTGGGVRSVPLAGGSVVSINQNPAVWIAVDNASLYWTSFTSSHTPIVQASSTTGGAPLTVASEQAGSSLMDGDDYSVGLTVGAGRVYWTLAGDEPVDSADDPVGALLTVDLAGGATTTLYSSKNQPGAVAVDDAHAYWVSEGTFTSDNMNGLVLKTPLAGGAITTLASGLQNSSARGIAVDASYVYWTNSDSGTVMKVPRCGGPTTTLASGQTHPAAIAVDATSVYWANSGASGSDGQIMKVTPK